MSEWQRPKADILLAGYLRGELERGRWKGRMPGVIRLARELGAARNTVERALRELEEDGLLKGRGHGRGRVIAMERGSAVRALRVGILFYEAVDRGLPLVIDLLHRLEEKGHVVVFAPETQTELRGDVRKIARIVGQVEADVWVVISGSQEVLEWFAAREAPAFALFGRRREIEIAGAGPDKESALRETVRRLCGLGHRRIVLYVRHERRKPKPGAKERAFLEELEAGRAATGPFYLPEWEETPDGFLLSLEKLLAVTPPTAFIFDEPHMFAAAQAHLAGKGMIAPRDVSLVCCDPPDPVMRWVRPRISHIRWEDRTLARRIVQWVGNVGRGRADLRQTFSEARFVEGGTIGPVPKLG